MLMALKLGRNGESLFKREWRQCGTVRFIDIGTYMYLYLDLYLSNITNIPIHH